MRDVLYPLRFRPIFKPAIWGGDALRPMLGATPSPEPTGEAWVLSDHGENPSEVVNGPLAGKTLRELMRTHRRALLGAAASPADRFPLLLKFLDARLPLSVQVHPNDEQAKRLEPSGPGLGKTEAWVVLKADEGGRVYAGLRAHTDRRQFREALTGGSLPEVLHSYTPGVGDCILLEAGTVHAIGGGLTLFEVQQTSDITYRLYDWDRVDPKTGQPRELHIEQALCCTNYELGPCRPVAPRGHSDGDEALVDCRYFRLGRRRLTRPRRHAAAPTCRVVVGVEGSAHLVHRSVELAVRPGDITLIPAAVDSYDIVPDGSVTLLECSPV